MSDRDLPITGQDTFVEMLVNGVPLKILDSVVSFTESAGYQKVESRHLGTADVDVEHVPDGWSGDLTVDRRRGQLDDFIDAYNAARRARIPVLINITNTKRFNDGSSRRHTYPDCKIDFSTSQKRGESVMTSMPWRSGRERI